MTMTPSRARFPRGRHCRSQRLYPRGDGAYAKALDEVLMQGVAPDAQIITMKVFGQNGGAYDSGLHGGH